MSVDPLAKGTEEFLASLIFWEQLHISQREAIQKALNNLPEKAKHYFEAQYYLLATKYDEFFIWSNLQEHEKSRKAQAKQLSAFAQKYVELVKDSQQSIDTGFKNLADVINLLPETIEQHESYHLLEAIEHKYLDEIKKPIIDVKREDDEDLTYPAKEKIYVPQAFQVLRYTGKEHLGLEKMWQAEKNLPVRDDLGLFLLSYLQSPYSIESPLIILGHPGSGKSLLTSVLTVRFAASEWTPIRIPLRNVDAGASIATQIEQQLCLDTNGEEVKWAKFARYLKHKPALILFDGYDELLQATGKVFSDYLLNVQRFQELELVQERPTRAIVTSRMTLIDKADIPKGATIIRLFDFNQLKQQQWISIWNATNASYFQQKKIEPFAMPEDNKQVKELAGQPLLLTMLAIYDSDDNQLHKEKELNQTTLYHNLIQRFIQRERIKSDVFKSWPQDKQLEDLKCERERLNVAAIGMFNRRGLFIHQSQLEGDLDFFQLRPRHESAFEKQDGKGWTLSPADFLLGGFFFVQRSEAEQKNSTRPQKEKVTAFDFLHNTFGEFLAADYILSQAFQLTETLYEKRNSKKRQVQREYYEMLEDINKLPAAWFACLMYTPLFTRPLVMTMMREWLDRFLEIQAQERDEDFQECKAHFLEELDAIVNSHIRLLFLKNTLPNLMTEQRRYSFLELPALGYLAIYTLNLILLRTIVSPADYMFDEGNEFLSLESNSTPQDKVPAIVRLWDRLTYLWRSWFSLENLNELAVILSSERKGNKIYLELNKKDVFDIMRHDILLDVNNVSEALADNIVAGLSGLLLHDPFYEKEEKLKIINEKISSEGISIIHGTVLKKQLLHLVAQNKIEYKLEKFLQILSGILMVGGWDNAFDAICIANIVLENSSVRECLEIDNIKKRLQDLLRFPPKQESIRVTFEILRLLHKINKEDSSFIDYLDSFLKEDITSRKENSFSLPIFVEVLELMGERRKSWLLNNLPYLTSGFKGSGKGVIPPSLAAKLIKMVTQINEQMPLIEVWRFISSSFHDWRKDFMFPEVALEIYTFAHKMKDELFLDEMLDYLQRLHDHYLPKVDNENFRNLSEEQIIALFKLGRLYGYRPYFENFGETYLHKVISQKESLSIKLLIELSGAIAHAKNGNLEQIKQLYRDNFDKDNLVIEDLSVNIAVELRSLAQLVGDRAMVERINKVLRGE